jgi:hypothetical protein
MKNIGDRRCAELGIDWASAKPQAASFVTVKHILSPQ